MIQMPNRSKSPRIGGFRGPGFVSFTEIFGTGYSIYDPKVISSKENPSFVEQPYLFKLNGEKDNIMTFARCCEWGLQGLRQLAPTSSVIVIVDVLSFSTCVEVAASRGATIFPYRWKDKTALSYAKSVQAELASFDRRSNQPSLSPSSLLNLPAKSRLVLPSPNGATLSLETGNAITIAACLRNAVAVAEYVQSRQTNVAVIPAGERWPDGSLRPAIEDWLAAGAVLSHLTGSLSPEAEAAVAAFHNCSDLQRALCQSASGQELIERGFEADVELAAQLNVSCCVPILNNSAFCAKGFAN
jgi:2-phosphosulfolactate phosphatase